MSDLTDRIDKELRQMAPHIRARKTAKLLEEASTALKRLQEREDDPDKFAHVIIESDFPSGNRCRCGVCIEVAKRMDDARWCEHEKDRWWEADQ